MLQPVVALAVWTMVMWAWMYATRIPAMTSARINPDKLADDPTQSLDAMLDAKVQWKAHNYNPLHEAPTVFYAIAIVIALADAASLLSVGLAWLYVALRIVHSLWHVLMNRVVVRFALFVASSLVLLALIVIAALAVFTS